jgi:hypothetical protein
MVVILRTFSHRPKRAKSVPSFYRAFCVCFSRFGRWPTTIPSGTVPDTHCGSPTLRTKSANRGSERMGSNEESVLKPSKSSSCSSNAVLSHWKA